MSQLRIGIIGAPTTLSYGFDSMTQYVGVPIEPVPARSDAYLNSFTISPSLPEGVNFSATDGTITGVFPSTASNNQVYTVVGSNQMGSVQTTIKFVVREEREMTENGYIGCYWSELLSVVLLLSITTIRILLSSVRENRSLTTLIPILRDLVTLGLVWMSVSVITTLHTCMVISMLW